MLKCHYRRLKRNVLIRFLKTLTEQSSRVLVPRQRNDEKQCRCCAGCDIVFCRLLSRCKPPNFRYYSPDVTRQQMFLAAYSDKVSKYTNDVRKQGLQKIIVISSSEILNPHWLKSSHMTRTINAYCFFYSPTGAI